MSEQDNLDVAPLWKRLCDINELPRLGSRVVKTATGNIAVFRTADDQVFALRDRCPHKGGPLSQGIVHGTSVTCPLHSWKIDLATGEAQAPDKGCARHYKVKLEEGLVWIALGD